MKHIVTLVFSILLIESLSAQSVYNARETFAPQFYPFQGNNQRLASGEPGPDYWQNSASYRIESTLDTSRHRIDGTVEITYTNNSPGPLSFIWLQLDQNIYQKSSRGTATTTELGGRWANEGFTGGFEIGKVEIRDGASNLIAKTVISDTRMQVWLPEPVKAKGGKTVLRIAFGFNIPEYGTDRMGRLSTKYGWVYEIAQWFPRLAVYDDQVGWNVQPYLGAGEFYLEYGDIEFQVTAPAGLIVVGSGELLNPAECYGPAEYQQYLKARESDQTVVIRSAAEVKKLKPAVAAKNITWKFRIENARDAAWAASRAFILDAAKIRLPGGKPCIALSAYPLESMEEKGGKDWRRSTEFVKASIEHYSSTWYEYPYPAAINVAGIVGGMEYPGIVFCDFHSLEADLWGVTDHEFGHTWFPMIVGSNERQYAWMDEGFNTFINDISTQAFRKGEFANASFFGNPNSPLMVNFIFGDQMDGLYTYPDVVQQDNLGFTAYLKPAQMLHALRNVVLGADRFDTAFREYIRRWAYKHPTPWDFFHCMENVAGEDLSWFWRGWVLNNWKLDQAIKEVRYPDNNPAGGAEIVLENLQKMVMPVDLKIVETNGKIHRLKLPVEIWQRGGTLVQRVPVTSIIKEVEIDPDMQVPDWDRKNNRR